MKNAKLILLLSGMLFIVSCASTSKKEIDSIGINELAGNFKSPPIEYSLTFYWGWDGEITEEVIARDLDAFKERGVHIVSLESGYDMGSPYLSEGWFKLVKRAVEMARERDMRVWIIDEGKYPSGFAGGKFTTDAPELRMKALVVAEQIEVESGDKISRQLSNDIVSAVAINHLDSTNQILDIQAGNLQWTAADGQWEVTLIKHDFRSSPTRAANNPTRGKDASNSLCDYLDPAATLKFIEFTHEEHKKYIGEEFGKTVLGFRGDEPDYSIRGIPWTTAIFEKFKEIKGYDVQPWVASFFAPLLTDEQRKVKADYWDVWSDMFAENFFKVQADWCAEHNLDYLVHLNREDKMMGLVAHEGDFFKNMRHVQMPGIDAIWNQIWPDSLITDFPKYASSVAHVYGKPRSFTESFAAYRKKPTVEQAKWVLDHQFVRGINMVEVMFIPASSRGKLGLDDWTADEKFAATARYIHRASYILSQGQPAARIAVYHPTSSMWLGDSESNKSTLAIMQKLLEHQLDFDFVDENAIISSLKLEKGTFRNMSKQVYNTLIIPSVSVMSKQALDRLQEFSATGGKVFFMGNKPTLMVDKTFANASEAGDLSWAIHEPSGKLTQEVMEALPEVEVSLNKPCPAVKYTHRQFPDADLYFFFNESQESQSCQAELAGNGQLQIWDAMTGEIEVLPAVSSEKGSIKLDLELKGYESKFIVVGDVPTLQ